MKDVALKDVAMKDERCCAENYCTQIVDEPLNLFMGKINKYITISVAHKFIYGVLIPHPSSLIPHPSS
jgi:hypothetical protein